MGLDGAKIQAWAVLVLPEAPGEQRFPPFPASRGAASLAHGPSSILTASSAASPVSLCL